MQVFLSVLSCWVLSVEFHHLFWSFIFFAMWLVETWCYSKGLGLNLQNGTPENRTLDHQRIPRPYGTLIGESILKGLHLNTNTKSHPKASKVQWKMLHVKTLTCPLAERVPKPRHPKQTTETGISLQGDKIQLHPPEHRHPQRGKFHKALAQIHPWGADTTIKRNYDFPACRQETPNTVNVKKKKRHRNMQQMKEQGENTQDQTNEEEISSHLKNNSK